MTTLLVPYILLALVAVLVLGVLIPPILRTYRTYRGKRLVTCPETKRPAAVDVDAKYAALHTSVEGTGPGLRLSDCSRWPERQNCGQECLAQVESAPEGCLVLNIVGQWYQGKSCVLCGKPLDKVPWYEHKPALLSHAGVTVEWTDIVPERLPDVLVSHKPICWNCHIAETFRREHPELVTDRDRDRSPSEQRTSAS